MGILQKIAAAFGIGQGESRPQNVTYSDAVMESFGVSSSGATVSAITAMQVAAVHACVSKIAGAISTLPFDVYALDGETRIKQPRDDLWYKLNEQPSEAFTAASHWEGVSVAQLLRGDAFTWIQRRMNGSIKALLPIPWASCSPMRMPDGSVRYYISMPEYGIQTWLEPADVLHFPGFGFDGLKSMSVIKYAARAAVGNALAMDSYSGKFFANGAHPSILLKTDKAMTQPQKEALQAAFAAKYSGADNFHKLPLVLTEGLDAKELSLSAEDSQLLEARKFQVIDIARAFGVPPHMIGETSASTSWGSGIESMSRGFVTYTLQPHLVKIEQELNRKLFPRLAGRFIRCDRDALIEGDSKAQADYNRAALGGPGTGMGWATVDEIRARKGLKPMGGKAAELFDPNAAAEAQMAAAEANKAAPAPAEPANRGDMTINLSTKSIEDSLHQAVGSIAKASFDQVERMAPIVNVAPPTVNVAAPIVNVAAPTVNFEAVMPEGRAPTVNVINNVEPAQISVTLPSRKTETSIVRDKNGNITKATQLETDA